MKPMRISQTENGFTLIEALVAMVVLSIGIFSLYGMQLSAIRGNASADHLTNAVASGQDTVEQLMSLDFTDSALSASSSANPHDSSELSGFLLPSSVSSVVWTVGDWGLDGIDNNGDGTADDSAEGYVKKIAVTVNYSNGKTTTLEFLKQEDL